MNLSKFGYFLTFIGGLSLILVNFPKINEAFSLITLTDTSEIIPVSIKLTFLDGLIGSAFLVGTISIQVDGYTSLEIPGVLIALIFILLGLFSTFYTVIEWKRVSNPKSKDHGGKISPAGYIIGITSGMYAIIIVILLFFTGDCSSYTNFGLVNCTSDFQIGIGAYLLVLAGLFLVIGSVMTALFKYPTTEME